MPRDLFEQEQQTIPPGRDLFAQEPAQPSTQEQQSVQQLFQQGDTSPPQPITAPGAPDIEEEYNRRQQQNAVARIKGEVETQGINLAPPTVTQDSLSKYFGGSIPEGINVDALNKELTEGFNPMLDSVNVGQFSFKQTPSQVQKVLTFDQGVKYDKELTDLILRASLSRADNDAERQQIIEGEYGAGSYRVDSQNRPLYLDPDTKEWHVIDKEDITLQDIADMADEAPVVAATLGAAMLTGGQSLVYQLAADIGANAVARAGREGLEELSGGNLEDFQTIKDRIVRSAYMDLAGFGVGWLGAKAVNFAKNPFGSGVTPSSRQVWEDMRTMEKEAKAKGITHESLMPTAYNESPTLARFIGIVSKLPGAASYFGSKTGRVKQMIDEEAEFLTKNLPVGVEKLHASKRIKRNLIKAYEGIQEKIRSSQNARYTGVDPVTGAEVAKDGVEVALATFKADADARSMAINALVGDTPFISTAGIKQHAREELSKIPKRTVVTTEPTGVLTARGEAYTREVTKKQDLPKLSLIQRDAYQQIQQLDDTIPLHEAQNLRWAWGNMMRTQDPTAGFTEGQAKALYGKLTNSMKSTAPPNNLPPGDKERFVKEFSEFNDWYKKKHEVFNEKGSVINKIFRTYSPDDLANTFFRAGGKNSITNVRLMKKELPPEKFNKVRDAVQDILLTGKGGTELVKNMEKMGQETLETWFGPAKAKELVRYAQSTAKLEDTHLVRTISSKAHRSMDLFNKWIRPKDPEVAMQTRKFLMQRGAQGRRDLYDLQLGYAQNMLQHATVDGVLNGKLLLETINETYGKSTSQIVLRGTNLYDNLTRLGRITKAADVKAEAAGGLAAGFLHASLLMGKKFGAAAMKYTKVTVLTSLTARALDSKTAKLWITNEPMKKATQAQIRAMTESVLKVADLEPEIVKEGKKQAEKYLSPAYTKSKTMLGM